MVKNILLTFYSWILILTHQQQTALENIVGKGEIAHFEQFLLFPLFSTQADNYILICPYFWPHIAAELEGPKIAISGKGLNCR